MAVAVPSSHSTHRCFLHLCALIFAVSLTLLNAITPVGSQNVSLSIRNFSQAQDLLSCEDPCSINGGVVGLPLTALQFSAARVMYKTPVQFFDPAAGTHASFTTSFLFTIASGSSVIADGLAFVIAPNISTPTDPTATGGALGLFPTASGGTGAPSDGTTHLVAVEFDTFYRSVVDSWDPNYAPHVGLDLNSLNSTALSQELPEIKAGNTVRAWIEYSAVAQQLRVNISVAQSPNLPADADSEQVLAFSDFNLSAFVRERSFVGFSAATGTEYEINTISEWDFTTSLTTLPVPGAAPEVPASAPSVPASPPAAAPQVTGVGQRSGISSMGTKLGFAIGLPMLLAMTICSGCWCYLRRRKRAQLVHSLHLPQAGYGPRRIAYSQLKRATSNFSTVLGEGGFGAVFKGVMADGGFVAVKRVRRGSRDGEKQFLAEVTSIGQLSHKNLVPLKGWCAEHEELLLVYEYMPNGSLDRHLYPAKDDNELGLEELAVGTGLDWGTRVSTIQGVADALCHLHRGWQQPVIHRDIKPSNVMLDASFVPRLGDFGLVVAMNKDKLSQTVTGAAGTVGYLAPECHENFKVGADSDVFSFGVMVLEMVCGRKPMDWRRLPKEYHLVSWVWSLYVEGEGSLMDAVPPAIRVKCDEEKAVMLLQLGLMCSFPDPSIRPSMSLVTQYLTGSLQLPDLPRELPPAFSEAPTTVLAKRYAADMRAHNSYDTGSTSYTGTDYRPA